MEPSGPGFKAQGSFGIPEEMRKQMEASREKHIKAEQSATAQATPPPPTEPAPNAAPQKELDPKKPPPDKDKQAEFRKGKEFWEDRLEIKITERDVRDCIFKGKLVKEMVAVPGYMKVTFQSLTAAEELSVDAHMAEWRENNKWTAEGLNDEYAIAVLSRGWLRSTEIEDGVTKPARTMGETDAERHAAILRIATRVLREVVGAWKGFNALVDMALEEKYFLKK